MITISLCMIVKNEEQVIGRILGQMKLAADEIIVVDTGSTDRTKEIASQYTPLVYDYPWKEDFAAARNFACSKAVMDYWMWLDADDVVPPDQQKLLIRLKENLKPDTDMVMMKYLAGFDENNNVTFSYYRERIIKNSPQFRFEGRVHETVVPHGNILYTEIAVEHRKIAVDDPGRNLHIYQTMLAQGEVLEPRHQFYYGRELYYHGQYGEAAQVFLTFLEGKNGWVENKIEACLQLANCYEYLAKKIERLEALLYSFVYDIPRAEACCEIGRYMMEQGSWRLAIYWYQQALGREICEESGAFVQRDCYGYIPAIQLCVCYDKLGDYEKALEYHKESMKWKPESEAVRENQVYFENRFKDLCL